MSNNGKHYAKGNKFLYYLHVSYEIIFSKAIPLS